MIRGKSFRCYQETITEILGEIDFLKSIFNIQNVSEMELGRSKNKRTVRGRNLCPNHPVVCPQKHIELLPSVDVISSMRSCFSSAQGANLNLLLLCQTIIFISTGFAPAQPATLTPQNRMWNRILSHRSFWKFPHALCTAKAPNLLWSKLSSLLSWARTETHALLKC